MADNNNNWSKRGLKHLGRIGVSVLLMSVSQRARFLLAGMFVIVALWLLHGHAWRELRREVGLPSQVVGEVPEVDIEALRSVNTQRFDRMEGERRDYAVYDRFFAAPVL